MKEKKLPVFFFSLLFASFIWLSIDLGNEFKTTIVVPVQIENLQTNRAIATPLPQTLRMKIQGTGWQLLSTMLSPNLQYTIDFSKLSRKDTLFTYNNLAEHISLPHSIRISETLPETVLVLLDVKVTKKIPIVPFIRASYRNGFGIVGGMKAQPESISITGARSLLNMFSNWPTKIITLNDVNAPVTLNVEVSDSLSLEVSRSLTSTSVMFDVQPIAEKTIEDIPIDVSQVPENRKIVLIPPTVSIIIRSGVNAIASLTQKDFYAFIDYRSILLDTSGTVQPIILGPENVKIVRQDPDRIQYVVRK
ncbi:MAG: hypothetical protein PHP42_02350 [Bacteroidota bacterium]|nr:hypothetical protein [Bacteroidota bacterium]